MSTTLEERVHHNLLIMSPNNCLLNCLYERARFCNSISMFMNQKNLSKLKFLWNCSKNSIIGFLRQVPKIPASVISVTKMLFQHHHKVTEWFDVEPSFLESLGTSYLIFVNFGTPPHYLGLKKYTKKCVNLRQSNQKNITFSMLKSTPARKNNTTAGAAVLTNMSQQIIH